MLQPCVHIHLQRNWLAVMPQRAAELRFLCTLCPLLLRWLARRRANSMWAPLPAACCMRRVASRDCVDLR